MNGVARWVEPGAAHGGTRAVDIDVVAIPEIAKVDETTGLECHFARLKAYLRNHGRSGVEGCCGPESTADRSLELLGQILADDIGPWHVKFENAARKTFPPDCPAEFLREQWKAVEGGGCVVFGVRHDLMSKAVEVRRLGGIGSMPWGL